MNQTQLANAIGVSLRTIRGWEIEGRYPKQHDLYQKLADTLGCDVSYLMTEEESFITEASEQYGSIEALRRTGQRQCSPAEN